MSLAHSLCFLSLLVAAWACGSGPNSPDPTADTTIPSGVQESASPSPSRQSADDVGPLALLPPSDFRSLAGGQIGPIEIGDECVTVGSADGTALLIWHAEDVAWDEDDEAIVFQSAVKPSATPVLIEDGDIFQFGGISDPAITTELTFLVPPDDICQGIRLIVDFVEFVETEPQ